MTTGATMTDGSAACHCHALRRAARRLTAFYDARMAPFGIRVSQWALLNRLSAAGPASATILAHDLGVDRTTMARNLRPLERAGLVAVLVASGAGRTDGRVRRLTLTSKGAALLARAAGAWEAAQAEVEQRFGTAEITALQGALGRLEAAVDGPE